MGLIRDFALDEIELEEFSDSWKSYREIVGRGVYTASSEEIRNLHAVFSLVLSHKILQQADLKFLAERAKDFLEIERSKLLYTIYKDDTVQKNLAGVQNDPDYLRKNEEKLDARRNEIIMDAEVRALETIVFALSRELSSRLK